MTMDVKLPDGTVVQGIPDGTTKQQLAERLQKNGMKVPQDWLAPTPKPTAGQRARSFVGGLNLATAEKDPGMQAVEAGAVPEAAGPVAAAKAIGKFVPGAGDWLDRALGKFANATPEQRAAQVIQKSASDLPAARARLAGQTAASPLVKGAKQTTAQAAQDEGLLGLERTVRNMPGAAERAGREVATPSNLARSRVVGAMAGTPERVAKAEAARDAAAEALYRQADNSYVNVDSSFKKLLERPSMKGAIIQARKLAKEEGKPLGPGDLMKSGEGKTVAGKAASPILDQSGKPISEGTAPSKNMQVSGRGLHYLKMALDKQLEKTPGSSLTKVQRRLITQTRKQFLDWAEERIPEYKQARVAYAKASKPINRMELMQLIQERATSNATDAAGNKIITRSGYQNAVKQYRDKLEKTMTPAQLKHIDAVAKDLDNAEKVNSPLIKPSGSETFRNITAASVLSRLTGGHGFTSAATQVLAKFPAFGWLRDVPPEQVREILVDAMLDPEVANKLLAKATPKTTEALSEKLQGIAKELGIGQQAGRQATRAGLAGVNAIQQGQQQ